MTNQALATAGLDSILDDDNVSVSSMLGVETKVGQIIKPAILECSPDTLLQEAAQRMSDMRVSSILVVEDNRAVGIWTERDVLKLDLSSTSYLETPVRDVMSWPLKTISTDLKLQELAVLFREEQVRHYIVVDEQGRRCGMVSQTDVVVNQGIESYLKLRSIDSVVHRGLQSVAATDSLTEVTSVMRKAGVDAVAVRFADASWGIITERDLVRCVAGHLAGSQAGEIASRPLLTVSDEASLYHVRNQLIKSRMRHIGVVNKHGGLIGLVSFRDILSSMELTYVQELQQALKERDKALSISQRNLRLAEQVIESSLEGIVVTDLQSNILSVNPAFTRLTGYTAEEIIGKTPAVLSSGYHDSKFYQDMWRTIQKQGYWQGEVWNKRKNGEVFPELLTITAISNGDNRTTHYAALFSDITELKENEERIRQLAYYDRLTELPNRRLLEDRLEVALARAKRNQHKVALLFIDLDRFKRINDSLGHDIGDQLLSSIAGRLCSAVRTHDTIARMGGDEFIGLLVDLESPAEAVQVAKRMLELLQAPVIIEGHELVVTSSIGISIYPEDGEDSTTLLRNADAAMYRSKGVGRNAFQLYTASMNASSLRNLTVENALYHALERGELELYYQPVMNIASNSISAAEALIRWNRNKNETVLPGDFLAVAEESDLIVKISDWVVQSACQQLARWHKLGYSELQLSINMASRHFYQPGFCQFMQHCLAESGVPAQSIILELTENMLMDNVEETNKRLEKVRGMGMNIALDDFGTGFSSLTHLRSYPLDKLKIDRAFVQDLKSLKSKDAAIIEAMLGLARSLGLKVVAEGVENQEQALALQKLGYKYLQGFYYSKPVPADEFSKLLARY